MRGTQRILGLVLLCAALLCMAPQGARADVAMESKADWLSGVAVDGSTVIGFAGKEWYVIGYNGNGVTNGTTPVSASGDNTATLLLKSGQPGDLIGGYTPNSEFGSTSAYENGTLHGRMSSIYTGFSTGESALVASRTIDQVSDGTDGYRGTRTLASQYVWPLSEQEARSVLTSASSTMSYGSWWWLRSPDYDGNFAWAVPSGGGPLDYFVVFVFPGNAVRPAFKLNLSSVLFTSAAAGGKSSAVGAALEAAQPPTGAVKLTVSSSDFSVSSATVTSVSGNTITFDYSITGTGYNRLSAIIQASDGSIKYYGNLKGTPGASGSASVTVPGGLAATDKLYVFAEQVNGDNLTDYASTFVGLTRAAPTGLMGVNCTTAANNDGKITGTTTDMEYSADGTTWTACTGIEITGLTPGTYKVRYLGTVNGITAIDSSETNVTVGAYNAPAITGVSVNPTSLAPSGGTSTVTVSGTGLAGQNIVIGVFDSTGTAVDGTTITGAGSQPFTFPANSTGQNEVYTIKVSLDGGVTWQALTATVTVKAQSSGGDDDGPDPNATPIPPETRTLTDPATGVSVTGPMYDNTTLRVSKKDVLHAKGCRVCDLIRKLQAEGYVLVLYDVELVPPVGGDYGWTVTIPVGTQHNGKTLSILHCDNGIPDWGSDKVKNGNVQIGVGGLSPFAVLKGQYSDLIKDDVPKTGDGFPVEWLTLALVALVAGAVMLLYKSNKSGKKRV